MRRAAPSPRPDVPGVRRGQARVRGRRGDRGGLQLCGAPPPAGARQAAPAGDRAGPAHRGCPHGGRTARRQPGAGAHRPAGPGRLPPGGQRSDLAGLAGGAAMTIEAGLTLPELVIEVTPTFVISTAIATRDFQDVHHDRDRAVERGGKDIFVNILTTTGPVQPGRPRDGDGPHRRARERGMISGAAAIAGIGATEFSNDSGRSELQLAAEAASAALADAGLSPSDVDGLVTFTMDSSAEVAVARELGVRELRFFSQVSYGGGAACATVQQAAMAIVAGVAEVVICYRALNERSGHRFGQVSRGAV